MARRKRDDGEVTEYVKKVAAVVLRVIKNQRELPIRQLVKKVHAVVETSEPSVRRAITWLVEEHGAPIRYHHGLRKWIIDNPEFALPLLDPTADDIVAVAFAGALLSPLGDKQLDKRIQALLMELDERVSSGKSKRLRNHAVVASSSSDIPVKPRIVSVLATGLGRSVVRIKYASPWRDDNAIKTHVIEPWQLRVHDGTMYVRGWLRSKQKPATFTVAHIQTAVPTGEDPEADMPAVSEMWGPGGLGGSVDNDRGDRAKIRIRGPMARYVGLARWSKKQKDTWIEPNELLEREFDYQSCRATARRLLRLGDALELVEPKELREELRKHVEQLHKITT